MSSFTLTNTAAEIDSAITRVDSADITPTIGSDNMVTSGGVKAAIDSLNTDTSTDVANIQTDLNTRAKAAIITSIGAQTFDLPGTGNFYQSPQYRDVNLENTVSAPFASLSNDLITVSAGHYLFSFGFEASKTQDGGGGGIVRLTGSPGLDISFYMNSMHGNAAVSFGMKNLNDEMKFNGIGANIWNRDYAYAIKSLYLFLPNDITVGAEAGKIGAINSTAGNMRLQKLYFVFLKL
ncbi:hypothetical protein [uncultured Mediterranean phage uvMED]|nr:hypothetical protein [uncultured Mediterranean phage uvMED]BAR22503.1 hypothetical protein [uncultured Mediterranean phage uvMED]